MFYQYYVRLIQRMKSPPPIQPVQITIFSTRPVLYLGYSQDMLQLAIDELQIALQEQGYLSNLSGTFDEETQIAVKEFQRTANLCVDGVVGSLTWAALIYPVLKYSYTPDESLKENIVKLQTLLLKERDDIKLDGVFGKVTESALRDFQKQYGLHPDGICGPLTWSVLLGQRLKKDINKYELSWPCLLDQLFIVVAIHAGIHVNPFGGEMEFPFFKTIILAYGLTCLVEPILNHLISEHLVTRKFPLLRFAPYVVMGFLWSQILNGFRLLVFKS